MHLTKRDRVTVSNTLAQAVNTCIPFAGYNVPDWANWEDNPGAYEPDPATMEALTAQSKPWFPYNPKDANPEDEFPDHEAEVDISDIHIPGKRHKDLLHI